MEMKRLNASGLKGRGLRRAQPQARRRDDDGHFEYANVSPEIYRRLMSSPTPASYYHDAIEEEFTPRRIK